MLAPSSPLPYTLGATGCAGWLGQRMAWWSGATHVPTAELNGTRATQETLARGPYAPEWLL